MILDTKLNFQEHIKNDILSKVPSLVITGALRDSSWENLYQELGLESLKQRRCYMKLLFLKTNYCFF